MATKKDEVEQEKVERWMRVAEGLVRARAAAREHLGDDSPEATAGMYTLLPLDVDDEEEAKEAEQQLYAEIAVVKKIAKERLGDDSSATVLKIFQILDEASDGDEDFSEKELVTTLDQSKKIADKCLGDTSPAVVLQVCEMISEMDNKEIAEFVSDLDHARAAAASAHEIAENAKPSVFAIFDALACYDGQGAEEDGESD